MKMNEIPTNALMKNNIVGKIRLIPYTQIDADK